MLSGGTIRKVARFHPFRQVIALPFGRRALGPAPRGGGGRTVAACDLRPLPSPRYL